MVKLVKRMLWTLPLLLLLSGCGLLPVEEEKVTSQKYYLYEVNESETDLKEIVYEPSNTSGQAFLNELKEIVNGEGGHTLNLLPETVMLKDIHLSHSILSLNFSEQYKEIGIIREILIRYALVRMFIQSDEVSAVVIEIEGEPLRDSRGQEIGAMTYATFTENMSKNLHSYRFVKMVLYFMNKEGTALVPEERKLYYMSNLPLERVILEQLIQGPTEKDALPTLSEDLRILSVVDSDGVCYINFDEAFLSDVLSRNPELVIYSIVNSILGVSNVEKVQISVSGNSTQTFGDMIDLNQFYEKNEELIQEKKTDSSETS